MEAHSSARLLPQSLSKARLVELGREIGVAVPRDATKEAQLDAVNEAAIVRAPEILRALTRAELKSACRTHGLDDGGRSRDELIQRLLDKLGVKGAPKTFRDQTVPVAGDIVLARQRQYLVSEIVPAQIPGDSPLVRAVCIDDDAQGRPLEVLWDIELGARVLLPETAGLGEVSRFDPPRHFAAYLHALKWNCVTATDARPALLPEGVHR